MQIEIFENLSSDNTINKELVSLGLLNIGLRSDFNLTSPELVLKGEFANCNYIEFIGLGRFYFVDRIENMGSNFYKLFLRVDVLETYKSEILASKARFRRQIKTGDYLNATLDFLVNAEVETIESDKGFSGEKTLILTTVGA